MSSRLGRDIWDEELRQRAQPRRPAGMLILAGLGMALPIAALLVWGVWLLLAAQDVPRRQVLNVSLLRPPPPPPAPPPLEQKPPEPKIEEPVEEPEPKTPRQAEETPPPTDQLGLDAQGSGDSDAFGLVGKKGGADITRMGGPPGGSGNRFGWFTERVQNHLRAYLRRNDELRRSDYKVVVRIWFAPDGRMNRYEIVGSSGNPEIDRNLKLSLDTLPPLEQPPPADMPQPVRLRVSSRAAG